jgi:hypothetical protein
MANTKTLRRRAKPKPEPRFRFTEVIAMEILRTGLTQEIPRGRVLPIDHELVRHCPEYFRCLGPRVDQLEEVNDAA